MVLPINIGYVSMLGKQCFCNLGKILTSKSRYVAELSLERVLGGYFSTPGIWGSEKRTEREMESITTSTPRFENLTTALPVVKCSEMLNLQANSRN